MIALLGSRLLASAIVVSTLAISTAWSQAASEGQPVYIGSSTCIGCHREEGEAWRTSHHALAWTKPSSETVLADFDNAVFEHQGILHRFYRDGDDYVIETDGPDGVTTAYSVVGVAGIEPLQQYLLETEVGRLQAHDVAWDVVRGEWFHLYPEQQTKTGDGLHWTGPYKTWNSRCAECHATGYEKGFDNTTKRYQSTQVEIGVGCEACHGPGSRHRSWATDGTREVGSLGLTVDFTNDDTESQIQQCAGCHSRREPFADGNPPPGTPFHDSYRLALLRPNLYHSDGTILDEVYVFGSFLQSKMYSKGVRCSDCHDSHKAQLKADGNAVCTQCHSQVVNIRFPSLTLAHYDSPKHHFHPMDSKAAACVSCHMIERRYMQVDPRRDHSFRVPRPDLSIETGAPNACTDCHESRDAAWAAAELAKRFPASKHRGPHFSQVLAAARSDPTANAHALLNLGKSIKVAGIVRATALDMLAPVAESTLAAEALDLLEDSNPLVRAAAIGVQRAASPAVRARRIWPLLIDERRSVRLAAARALLDIPRGGLSEFDLTALRNANREWQEMLAVKSDFPETHLVLGGMALTMRNFRAAEAAFGEVVRLDPNQVNAWLMLTRIRDALGDRIGAKEALQKGLASNPTDVDLLMLEKVLGE
jgi:predicted CXXCH cytochrome family protein